MSPDTLEHPTQLGNYDVLSKIAEGGMGTVYKAVSRVTGEIVAVKVISPGPARNPVVLQRFEREFAAARVLDHPNVVRAIEYSGAGPHPFLVMEFVDGESLGQRIERSGPIAEAEAVRLIGQVCDGLQRAHKQGLVHRDVKPDNIMVNREGIAKLTDMGLVKEIDNDLNLTKTGRGLGTPHYMAPEQFRNAKTVDIRSDVYSLGATLYALVTGMIPFDNTNPLDCWMKKIRNEFPTPKEMNPNVSDRVDWAIRRSMSAEPAQRPTSCREFLEDLTGQSRTSATPSSTAPPPGRSDVWYMVYKDETGQSHTVKGATEGIRNALKDNLLGDAAAILVGRAKPGPFVPIGSVPEFRDLVVAPAPLPPSGISPVGPGGSARITPAPMRPNVPADRPAAGQVLVPTEGVHNSQTVTSDYSPAPSLTPLPVRRPAKKPKEPERNRRAKKPFDWTPILLVVIALLSAIVGYYIFMK
ncbi:MAG TPA: protein kinase [Urbifossiella sp.]|jgi:serine/threonine protein kinase